MRTRVGTALWLAGVLAAGSLAAFVNSQVLDTSSSRSARASSTSEPWGPAATDVDDSVGQKAKRKKTTEARLIDPTPNPGDPFVYAAGSAGTVTVTFEDGNLTLEDATPVAGWRVLSADATGPNQVQVIFRSGTSDVTFTAAVAGDRVVALVSVTAVAGSRDRTTAATSWTPPTTTTTSPPTSSVPTRPPTSTPSPTSPPTTPATTSPPSTAPPTTEPPPTTTTEPVPETTVPAEPSDPPTPPPVPPPDD
jgi:hypothetical protein